MAPILVFWMACGVAWLEFCGVQHSRKSRKEEK